MPFYLSQLKVLLLTIMLTACSLYNPKYFLYSTIYDFDALLSNGYAKIVHSEQDKNHFILTLEKIRLNGIDTSKKSVRLSAASHFTQPYCSTPPLIKESFISMKKINKQLYIMEISCD